MTAPTRAELERMILTLRSNGYDVTKQPDPGAEYVNGIAAFAEGIDGTRNVTVLPSQGGHQIIDVINDAVVLAGGRDPRDVEVYVEIDRAMLLDEIQRAVDAGTVDAIVGDALWVHQWPIVARVDDEGDVILHVTSGDRAQGGAGE